MIFSGIYKGSKIRTIPPILTFSLLRFDYDFQRGERFKVTDNFHFSSLYSSLHPSVSQSINIKVASCLFFDPISFSGPLLPSFHSGHSFPPFPQVYSFCLFSFFIYSSFPWLLNPFLRCIWSYFHLLYLIIDSLFVFHVDL